MAVLIVYSSVTGNTRSVCERVFESLSCEKRISSVREAEKLELSGYERVIVGFWCRRSTMDEASQKFLRKLEDKEVFFLGTLAARPESPYATRVYENARKLCEEKNSFRGGLLIWGRPSQALMDRIRSRPAGSAHAMTPEREQRWKEAASHPDEADMQEAIKYFRRVEEDLC